MTVSSDFFIFFPILLHHHIVQHHHHLHKNTHKKNPKNPNRNFGAKSSSTSNPQRRIRNLCKICSFSQKLHFQPPFCISNHKVLHFLHLGHSHFTLSQPLFMIPTLVFNFIRAFLHTLILLTRTNHMLSSPTPLLRLSSQSNPHFQATQQDTEPTNSSFLDSPRHLRQPHFRSAPTAAPSPYKTPSSKPSPAAMDLSGIVDDEVFVGSFWRSAAMVLLGPAEISEVGLGLGFEL